MNENKQTEIGGKKGGMLRKSFSRMGRMFNTKKGGAKPTLTHTAPEAYSRNGAGGLAEGEGARGSPTPHDRVGELSEEAIYGRRASSPGMEIRAKRAQSDGMILKQNFRRR